MAARTSARPLSLYMISLCLLIVALGALPAGALLILDPSGTRLGFPTGMLSSSPFADYLIPGLFLFTVNGVGALVVLYALWSRPRSSVLSRLTRWTQAQWPWAAALGLGLFLIAWIILQVVWIQTFSFLQVMIGGLGIAIVVLDLLPATRAYFHL